METILNTLEQLNFSKMEANIYITLLKNGELNGSEIAKILNCSKSAVYDYLKIMQEKKSITAIEGSTIKYLPKNPEELMDEIEEQNKNNIKYLKKELSKINTTDNSKNFWDFKGEYSFTKRTSELIRESQEEILLSSNCDLSPFKKELDDANRRGVRIIFFTSTPVQKGFEYMEHYYKDFGDECFRDRLLLVVDNKKTLVASNEDCEIMIGTYTENILMKRLIAEHIHHDIYLKNLEDKFGEVMVKDDIQVKSLYESSPHYTINWEEK